jgi:hypothetical protein
LIRGPKEACRQAMPINYFCMTEQPDGNIRFVLHFGAYNPLNDIKR